jgi:hypothetical protein
VFVSEALYDRLVTEGLTHLKSNTGVELLGKVFTRKNGDYPALRYVVSNYCYDSPKDIASMMERPASLRVLLEVDGLDSALSREVVEELNKTERGRSAINFIEDMEGGNAEILRHYASSPFNIRTEAPTSLRSKPTSTA